MVWKSGSAPPFIQFNEKTNYIIQNQSHRWLQKPSFWNDPEMWTDK